MKLYFKYFLIHLKSQMQYKTSFFLTLFGQFLSSFSMLVGIWFMMSRFSKVEDFTFAEILLCFGTVLLAFSAAECFARGFDTFSSVISNGEFDRILVRPRNEIFQVLASKIEFTRLGRLVQAVLVFCYALPASGVHWTADRILTLLLMLLCGTAVFSGLFVVYAAFCFFTIEGLEFMNIFTHGGKELGSYPLDIYGSPALIYFFTFLVPLACAQYYPFLYLTGRSDSILYLLSPLWTLVFLGAVLFFWKIGVKHYQSTGS